VVEAMALHAGIVGRLGRTEDGSTLADTDPEEIAHRISLSLSVVPLEWKGHKLNIIDTPGDPDFEGEVRAALWPSPTWPSWWSAPSTASRSAPTTPGDSATSSACPARVRQQARP
jgi:hypothetical protein